jgi:hypothetical protein
LNTCITVDSCQMHEASVQSSVMQSRTSDDVMV